MAEARQVAREIGAAPDVDVTRSPVALVFDYDAAQGWDIQPHGRHLDYFSLVFGAYKAMRALGLSVDILPASTGNFAGYRQVAREIGAAPDVDVTRSPGGACVRL